jgi:uncharacterized surface protein with fasciclin (FAS1) repeats
VEKQSLNTRCMKKKIFAGAFCLVSMVLVNYSADAQTNNLAARTDNPIPPIVEDVRTAAGSGNDIVSVTSGLRENGTLTNAFKASGLDNNLKLKGPFTVFAPDNGAFAKLPPGLVEQLMKRENADKLSKILSYHVIQGTLDMNSLRTAIKKGNGKAEFTTLCGNKITASIEDNKIKLTDDGANACFITTGDVHASNGIIHVVDKVALPR